MDNVIFIKYQYPYDSNLIGREEFNNELRNYCIVQDRLAYAPHCYECFELWNFQIFINHPIIHFMAGAIASGLFWDKLKIVSSNAFEAFKKFQDRNENFQISEMAFEFDDITIVLCQSVASNYNLICQFFVNFEGLIKLLKSNNIDNIYRISYPYHEMFEGEIPICCDAFTDSLFQEEVEESYVKVDYAGGCETIYYQPSTGDIRDTMGNIIRRIAKYGIIQ